jgi:hypothetical protein
MTACNGHAIHQHEDQKNVEKDGEASIIMDRCV